MFSRALAATGRELDTVVNGAVRGFPGPELVRRIRRRPSAPLLALLRHLADPAAPLYRTFVRDGGAVRLVSDDRLRDVVLRDAGTTRVAR